MNSAFPSRKMRDCELAHTFCFWKPYKHTRKMAQILSFQTIPHLYWKNNKGVTPANSFQPAFSGHSVIAFDINVGQWATTAWDEGEWRKTAEQRSAERLMAKWIAAEKYFIESAGLEAVTV